MAALPYMQFYVAEYLADTAHLTAEQHGAYLLLLMNYWQRGKSLKASDERLANIAKLSHDKWQEHKSTLAEFFITTPETWTHRRIERDIKNVNAKSAKAKRAGQASGIKRKTNSRSSNVEQTLNHKEQNRTEQIRKEYTDSDTNVSLPDFKKMIFDTGLKWLAKETGKPPDKLRGLVAKWCRDSGDAAVSSALIQAQSTAAIEPISYIERMLKPKQQGKPHGKHSGFADQDYSAGKDGFRTDDDPW